MRNYATQMDAAKRGIVTPEIETVAKKENRPVEFIMERVAKGTIAIPANINHKSLSFNQLSARQRQSHSGLYRHTAEPYSSFLLFCRILKTHIPCPREFPVGKGFGKALHLLQPQYFIWFHTEFCAYPFVCPTVITE